MTVFLTFGVYALKINGDMPVQSQYIPIVSVYFIVAALYTLFSLIWFILANYFATKSYIPKPLALVADKVHDIFDCESKKKPLQKSAPVYPIPEKENHIEQETVDQSFFAKPPTKEDSLVWRKKSGNNVQLPVKTPKCDSCNKCQDCEINEKEKKIAKKILDKNLKTLNLLAFLIIFLIMIISNLAIWISVCT